MAGYIAFTGPPADEETTAMVFALNHRMRDKWERTGTSIALHVLDLMAAAGVTPAEAAAQLRAGRTIEEVTDVNRFDLASLATVPLERTFRSALELTADGAEDPAKIATAALARRENLRRFADEHPTPEQEAERRQELKQASLDSAPDSGREDDAEEPTIDDDLRAHALSEELSFSQRAGRRGARARARS